MSARINVICRIPIPIEIFVQGFLLVPIPFICVLGDKPSRVDVQVPCTVVVEAEVRVELLPGVEIVVGRRTGPLGPSAERVVGVGVGDGTG